MLNNKLDVDISHSRFGVLDIENAATQISNLKQNGTKVGLCHGCFDILHFGHLRHLSSARSLCDKLFVSITEDKYVNKGPKRPIFTCQQRAEMLSGFACVDGVVISTYPTAIDVVDLLKPDMFIKGQEYHLAPAGRHIGFENEREFALANGIEVAFTFEETFSSTETLKRLYDAIKA